jgi:hypothetical protein
MLVVAMAKSVSGCFWEKQNASTEDESPEERDSDRNAPRGRTANRLGTEVDEVRNKNADGDEQLVTADNSTSQMRGRALTLVSWHDNAESSDGKAADNASDHHDIPHRESCSDLEDVADAENYAPQTDGVLATDSPIVGDWSGNESADKSTNGQHSH